VPYAPGGRTSDPTTSTGVVPGAKTGRVGRGSITGSGANGVGPLQRTVICDGVERRVFV
jgi:hypothetical protein